MSEAKMEDTRIENDEITLKELILKIQEFYSEIISNWKLGFLVVIPFVIFFLYNVLSTPLTYPAELTFMVNEDEGGGGMGGALAILNQFGLGSSSQGKYNLQKILELSKTRKIIQKSLFEKKSVNGKTDYLANHIIDIYELHKEWKKSKIGLTDFKYTNDSIPIFNLVENAALKKLHHIIIGSKNRKAIFSTSINEETGIMTLGINTLSEELSVHWLNLTYLHLSHYYIDKTTEKQQATYDLVKEKVDSIEYALKNAESKLAKFKDSNRGLFTQTAALSEARLNRNLQVLAIMYGEAIKNLEIADFSLKNRTPFIQLIDEPIFPITPKRKSIVIAIIMGGLIGGLAAVGLLVGRKIIRDSLKDDDPKRIS